MVHVNLDGYGCTCRCRSSGGGSSERERGTRSSTCMAIRIPHFERWWLLTLESRDPATLKESVRDKYPTGKAYEPPQHPLAILSLARGAYSSANEATLVDQMTEMKEAGIDVAVLSWWGRAELEETHDTQVLIDNIIHLAVRAAECWHAICV